MEENKSKQICLEGLIGQFQRQSLKIQLNSNRTRLMESSLLKPEDMVKRNTKKNSCDVTEVNSLTFCAKGEWNLFSFTWYFRQCSFTMGLKEKSSTPVLTLVPRWSWGAGKAVGRYPVFSGSGQHIVLTGCQNRWHFDAPVFKRERARVRVRQKQENGNLGSIKQAFKSYSRREHCHFCSTGLNKHWQMLAGMGEELIIAKHSPDEHCHTDDSDWNRLHLWLWKAFQLFM